MKKIINYLKLSLDKNARIRVSIYIVVVTAGLYFFQLGSDQGYSHVFPGLVCTNEVIPADECTQAYVYQGAINSSGVRRLGLLLSSNKLDYLCFDSGGGDSRAAVKIAKLIKKYQLKTCMSNGYRLNKTSGFIGDTKCMSNCIPTLLSASERHLFGASTIRTHRIGFESACIVNIQLEKWDAQRRFSGNHFKFIGIHQYMKIVEVGHQDTPPEFHRLASDTMAHSNYCGEPDEKLSLDKLREYKIFTQIFGITTSGKKTHESLESV
jgi:hypothetical protein